MVEPSTLCAINQEVLVPVPWTLGFFTLISHLLSQVSWLFANSSQLSALSFQFLTLALSPLPFALGLSAFHLPLSSNLKAPWGLKACLSEIDLG